ncbi:hypothetical protein PHMEG_00028304 [Phytophthora megakarya]|uniref:Uncharacterized protein n=1 Tax=Phytophthora megakarya TaxID=4795 RepID=A0A225V7S7_9STRA|nr:hypothetical protein PHMEG_00028304 [Phytophthora megakarya]
MADAGSRAWSPDHKLYALQRSLTALGLVLREHAIASTTSTKYRAHWNQWVKFSTFMKWSPWLTKAVDDSDKISMFVIFCWRYGWNGYGNQYDTIRLKVYAIRLYHRSHAGIELQVSPSFNVLLRGIHRVSDPVQKKQPIRPAYLRLLYRRLDLAQPRSRLLWGSILLAYFFLLRRSGYLRDGHQMLFSDKEGNRSPSRTAVAVAIGLTGSKNDQYGRGAWRTMHASGDSILCPKEALQNILSARKELNR